MLTHTMFSIWSYPNLSNLLTMMVKLTSLSLCHVINSSNWLQHLKLLRGQQKLCWIFSFEKDTLILKLVGIQFHQILLQIKYIHVYRFSNFYRAGTCLVDWDASCPFASNLQKMKRQFENLVKLTLYFSNVCG